MYRTKHMQSMRLLLVECMNQLPADVTVPTIAYLPQPEMASQLKSPVVYISMMSETTDQSFEDVSASKVRWFPTQRLHIDIYSDDAGSYMRHVIGWLKSRQYRLYQARNNISARLVSANIEPDHLRTSESLRAMLFFDVTIQDNADFAITGVTDYTYSTEG